MKYIPQLSLSDEEFDALQTAAAQANLGLYDYVLQMLVGRAPATARPPKWPPTIETKDAADAEVEPAADAGNRPAARRGRG